VVGADLESLVSAHDKSVLAILLVLQDTNIASASLFPLATITVELEELGTHLEGNLLSFLVCLGVDFLGQLDDRLELNVRLFLLSLVLQTTCQSRISRL
jgi:hypothetical protein